MKRLALRARIIIALVILALGATVAVGLVTANFLRQTPQVSTAPEMQQALTSALGLATRDYESRKDRLSEIESRLAEDNALAARVSHGDQAAIQSLLGPNTTLAVAIESIGSGAPLTKPGVERISGDQNRLELRVPTRVEGTPVQIVVVDELAELLKIEDALQTYQHLQIIIADLREGLVWNYVLIVVVMLILAGLIGVRIGIGITSPLSSLIQGTRELARDNLNYRIPPGPADEIGLLIDSFNRMAGDLEENRRKRVEAEKVAAWREIARRLAHEIKNPLTPIQLTVQQMRDKYAGKDEDYQKLLDNCTEIVTEEVESLRGLVQEFADFARMPQLALTTQNLNNVITDTIKLYSERRIELDLESDLPDLRLDLEGMRRVLINLVENAIDAAGEQGNIVIQTLRHNGRVRLSIIDEGPGVDQVDRERIFEPYISDKQDGTGLGLAMVRSIIQEHGGSITVSDNPAGGARFDIKLPISEA